MYLMGLPKLKNFNLHLYAVTDSKYKKLPIDEQVELAIKGGATLVQLREKALSFKEYVEKGKRVKKVCDAYNIPFIINDDVDVAKAVNSSGVHIGQSDMALEKARKVLGKDKIIGVSANTVEDALKAQCGSADYIGVGAIFATGTKVDAIVVGLDRLKEIVNAVDIPVVAIGGIHKSNCQNVKAAGVDGIAVVSAIFGSDNIMQAARELYIWKNI